MEKELYEKLSVLFGGFQELTQGAGGNISVKTETELILKASGTCLSEKDQYIICSLPQLNILEGCGKPSMEIGFHLLPKRFIVHFHSLSFLSKWTGQGLSLPYIQPGTTLSDKLHSIYNGESIIYLENHGIILLADTEEELYSVFNSIFAESFQAIFYCMKALYEETSLVFVEIPNPLRFLFFKSFTPDIFLFLKRKPFCISYELPVKKQLQEYQEQENSIPSIAYVGTKVFALGSSWKKCMMIRDMYDAYCKIIQTPPPKELTIEECNALLYCQKEAYRLR